MRRSLQPIVANNQQLIRVGKYRKVQPMVVDSRNTNFGERLNEALDCAEFPKGRERRKAVSKHFEVSVETVRKWLSGESLPKMERMLEIANHSKIQSEWLANGTGPKLITNASVPEVTQNPQAPALTPKEQFSQALDSMGVTDETSRTALWNLAKEMGKKARE